MIRNHPSKSHKYARVEEERRFLLAKMPLELDQDGSFVRIIDHYLKGTRLRLRRMESAEGEALAYKLGQKYRSPEQKAHQTMMTNIYLNKAEYEVFSRLPLSTLIKVRFSFKHDGYAYSIDRFRGHLAGLLLAEIESQGKIDIASLPVPKFAIKDITEDPFFIGANLADLSEVEFQERFASLVNS